MEIDRSNYITIEKNALKMKKEAIMMKEPMSILRFIVIKISFVPGFCA
jgi:hypothetical protein